MGALQIRYVQKYVHVRRYEKGQRQLPQYNKQMYINYDYFVRFHDSLEILERKYCIIRYSGAYVSYTPSKVIGYVLKILLPFPVF
jgi:hypothetical protein